jgi:hypothetical protein
VKAALKDMADGLMKEIYLSKNIQRGLSWVICVVVVGCLTDGTFLVTNTTNFMGSIDNEAGVRVAPYKRRTHNVFNLFFKC